MAGVLAPQLAVTGPIQYRAPSGVRLVEPLNVPHNVTEQIWMIFPQLVHNGAQFVG